MSYVNGCKIINVTCENAFNHGIEVQNGLNSFIQNCICTNNTERGIYVDASDKGGMYVVNNICIENSLGSDQVDIEFTSQTQDNFVWANKGNLLDSGINNQPPQEQVDSISGLAFEDYVKNEEIVSVDGNTGEATNPYGLTITCDGKANEGLYFLPVEEMEYNHEGNFYYAGKTRQIIISTLGGWYEKIDEITGARSLVSNSPGSRISISYYGTAILMLAKTGSGQAANLIKYADGTGTAMSLAQDRGSLNDAIAPVLLYSSQTKESHFVEVVRNDDAGEKTFEITGFLIQLSTDSANSIHMNESFVFVNGQKYRHPEIPDLPIPTFTGNARTDCITASTGGAYQVVEGSIISSGGETYGTSIDTSRPNEEVSVRDREQLPEIYSVSEFDSFDIDGEDFIRIKSKDPSLMMWAGLSGIYSGVKKDVATFDAPSLRLEAATDKLYIFVKGTGLDIEVGAFNGLDTENIEIWVDDVYRGDVSTPSVNNDVNFVKLPICSGLSDITHLIMLRSKSGNTQASLYLQRLIVYRSKAPKIPSNRIKVAAYRNLPFVSDPYIFHRLEQNMFLAGSSWAMGSYDPDRYNGSQYEVAGGLSNYFEIYFYGTGIKLFYKKESGSSAADVLIDGVPPSSLGAVGTGDTIPAGTSSNPNEEATWTGLAQAFHTLRITPTTGSALFKPNVYGVICGRPFGIQQQRNVSPLGRDISLLK